MQTGFLNDVKQGRGYRFSVDSVLLASFCESLAGKVAVDLGTGCGIVSMLLAVQRPGIKIYGLEIQLNLAKIARKNIRSNNLAPQIDIICGDMRSLHMFFKSGFADIVISNPPFGKAGAVRLNPDSEKAIARHELKGSLKSVAKAARYLLKQDGYLAIIYTAKRAKEVFKIMDEEGLNIEKIIPVYAYPGNPAKLIFCLAKNGGAAGIEIAEPFYICDSPGVYSDEMLMVYQAQGHNVCG